LRDNRWVDDTAKNELIKTELGEKPTRRPKTSTKLNSALFAMHAGHDESEQQLRDLEGKPRMPCARMLTENCEKPIRAIFFVWGLRLESHARPR
jgi:hypothetical protein